MAWEWSHSHEAYENARYNLEKLSLKVLIEIAAEWHAYDRKKAYEAEVNAAFNEDREEKEMPDEFGDLYDEDVKRLRKENRGFGKSGLVDFIWERMEEFATCDNGGFDAWACPYGCGCHTVSFSSAYLDNLRKPKGGKTCELITTF